MNPPSLDDAGENSNTGAIVGPIVGVALLLLAGFIVFAIWFKRNASNSTAGQTKPPPLAAYVRT